jgi:hypothetical protein
MKTLHRIKFFTLVIFAAIIFSFPLLSIAAPWSEQNAFCLDRVNYSGSYSNYSNQKIYNECMDNANELIEEYEKSSRDFKIEWDKSRIEQNRKWREERLVEQQRRKRVEKQKELANKQEIQKYDDLFSEFN